MKRILLVNNDDESYNKRLCEMIESWGAEVIPVASGAEAITRLFGDFFDIVLIDSVLFDLTGYEVARTITVHQEMKNTKIIFTVNDFDLHKDFAMGYGRSFEYIKKPVEYEKLKSLIDACFASCESGNENSSDDKSQVIENCAVDDNGFYNEEYIKNRLNEEINKAFRNKYSISIMKINITFKSKPITDASMNIQKIIFSQFREILKKSLRRIDITGVLENLNFMILLPRSTRNNAQIIAQKIRNSLHAHTFQENISHSQIVCNYGVSNAEFGSKADSDALIKSVDEAMMKSIAMGEDQIYVGA